MDEAEFLRPVVISPIYPVAVTWSRKCRFELSLNKIWVRQHGTHSLHPASPRVLSGNNLYKQELGLKANPCLSFCPIKPDKPYGFSPAQRKDKSRLENYSVGLLGMIKSILLLMMSIAKHEMTEVARN